MESIDIVPYSEKYEVAHTTFATKMWPNRIRRRIPEYNRWKFRGPEKGELDTLILAVSGDRVVGQLGLVPVNFRVKDKLYNTCWTVDLMVDPDFRRRGIASRLYKKAIEKCDIAMANGSNEGGSGTMLKIGFKKIGGPKKMLFPLNFKKVLSMKLKGNAKILIPILAFISKPIYFLRTFKIHTYRPKKLKEVHWRDLVGDIKKFQDQLEIPHPSHDRDFLDWRCSTFKIYNEEPKAIRSEHGSFAIYTKASQSLYVYEWHAYSKEDFLELFAYLLKEAKSLNVNTISAVCNFEEEENQLKSLGFIPMRKTLSTQLFYPGDHPLGEYEKFYYSLYDADENI